MAALSCGAAEDAYEQAPIHYSQSTPNDAAQRLQRELDSGKRDLDRSDAWAVLRGLMERFGVPVESQVLVFSKTSKQNDLISPRTPRAVYFGDQAYLGYCQGGVIEVATVDPRLGPIFYTLDPNVEERRPLRFERDQSCLSCHGGVFTADAPGVVVRSVVPSASGHPILSQGSTVVDSTTPFGERWGGWYVTGKHGESTHRGNVVATEQPNDTCDMPVSEGANVTDLAKFVDVSTYPRQQSDMVALMVLEHQTAMQNTLTKANHAALRAVHMQQSLQKELGETVTDGPVGSAKRIIEHAAEDILDGLLFKDEAPLPDGGVEGDEGFQAAFARNAVRTREGRSFKDFQLNTRLFKYRCSYMIHTPSFSLLQPTLKSVVLNRLTEVLEGTDGSERYAYIPASERGKISAMLSEFGVLPARADEKP